MKKKKNLEKKKKNFENYKIQEEPGEEEEVPTRTLRDSNLVRNYHIFTSGSSPETFTSGSEI